MTNIDPPWWGRRQEPPQGNGVAATPSAGSTTEPSGTSPSNSDDTDTSNPHHNTMMLPPSVLPSHRIVAARTVAGRVAFCRQLHTRMEWMIDFDPAVQADLSRFGHKVSIVIPSKNNPTANHNDPPEATTPRPRSRLARAARTSYIEGPKNREFRGVMCVRVWTQ